MVEQPNKQPCTQFLYGVVIDKTITIDINESLIKLRSIKRPEGVHWLLRK